MIRVVVAAVLTVATLAAVAPAVDDARATRVDAVTEGTVERIERAGRTLASTEDATRTRELAATRRIEVAIPRASLTVARTRFVAVGGRPGGPGNRSVLAYATASAPTRLRGLSLPVPVRTPDGPVVLRGAGRRAIEIALVRTPASAAGDAGGPALVVTRSTDA
ncbi:MAG: hypothetical protein ABEK02_05865 [Haloquadratum sp.]